MCERSTSWCFSLVVAFTQRSIVLVVLVNVQVFRETKDLGVGYVDSVNESQEIHDDEGWDESPIDLGNQPPLGRLFKLWDVEILGEHNCFAMVAAGLLVRIAFFWIACWGGRRSRRGTLLSGLS